MNNKQWKNLMIVSFCGATAMLAMSYYYDHSKLVPICNMLGAVLVYCLLSNNTSGQSHSNSALNLALVIVLLLVGYILCYTVCYTNANINSKIIQYLYKFIQDSQNQVIA